VTDEQKPAAWMLSDHLDAGLTTSSAYLWFSNPKNTAWEPIYTQAAIDAAVAAERAWRNTVDDMLTVCHAVASDDPRESINRLINWHVAVALDPAVSSDAAALVAAERERCAKLCELESVTLATRDQTRGALYCAQKIRQAPVE
jgi:hypothetical protein